MSTLAIVTPAEDRALLTLAELRAAAGVTGSAADEALTVLGNRVTAVIVNACRIRAVGATPATLRSETVAETFRHQCRLRDLILSRGPVTEIVSVVENGETLEAGDYELDAGAGALVRLSSDTPVTWPSGKIVVTYAAGWATVPDDLKLAAAKLAASYRADAERGDPNLRSMEIPGVMTRSWWVGPADDPAVPAEVMDLLARYTNHVFS